MDRRIIFTREKNDYVEHFLCINRSYLTGRRARAFELVADV